MTASNIHRDINIGEISSAYTVAPFDEGVEALITEGYRLISLEENARLRIQEGREHGISRIGNWVREGLVHISKKGTFLTKCLSLRAYLKEATQCYRERRDFHLTDKQVTEVLEDAIAVKDCEIPFKMFADNDITRFAFGECAGEYGEFLMRALGRKKAMPIRYTKFPEDASFVGPIYFYGIGFMSEFSWYNGYLEYGNVFVRGVRENVEGKQKIRNIFISP